MKIKFLGIGSAYNTKWLNSNAYFIVANSLYLLDCGESTFGKLMELGILNDNYNGIYVLLTHLHADHAGSLPSLCSYCVSHLKIKVQVVYPGNEVDTYLQIVGIPADDYEHINTDVFISNALNATALKGEHIPGYPSYGWMIESAGDNIYFSGDARTIHPTVLSKLLAGEMKMVYHDVEFNEAEKVNGCHLQYQQLLRVVPPENRSHFCCMHLNCDYRDMAQHDGFNTAKIDD